MIHASRLVSSRLVSSRLVSSRLVSSRLRGVVATVITSSMLTASATAVDVFNKVRQWTPTSTPNGNSWSVAYPTIEAALAEAATNGFLDRDVIFVGASGTSPFAPSLPPAGSASQLRTFFVDSSLRNVWLKGGNPFAGVTKAVTTATSMRTAR